MEIDRFDFTIGDLTLVMPDTSVATVSVSGPTTVAVYFEAAAVIVTLILLGRSLEAGARGRTSAAIRELVAGPFVSVFGTSQEILQLGPGLGVRVHHPRDEHLRRLANALVVVRVEPGHHRLHSLVGSAGAGGHGASGRGGRCGPEQ